MPHVTFDNAVWDLASQIQELCTRENILGLALTSGAPSSLKELKEAYLRINTHSSGGTLDAGRIVKPNGPVYQRIIPVDVANSDNTIWEKSWMNWLARAWHDWHHLELNAEFDAEGETRVAHYAMSKIDGDDARKVLWAELYGQVKYHATYGVFPTEQRRFVKDCYEHNVETVIDSGILYHSA
jgi:hypothetical protein